MTLPHLLPFIACCVCVCVCVCERDSWDSLLCTGLALPHLIRPFSSFSLACINIGALSCFAFHRMSPLFNILFSLLVAPISISLLFSTAYFFHHCSLATVPQSLSSSFVVSCSRNLLVGSCWEPIGSCRKNCFWRHLGELPHGRRDSKAAVYPPCHTCLCASFSAAGGLVACDRGQIRPMCWNGMFHFPGCSYNSKRVTEW